MAKKTLKQIADQGALPSYEDLVDALDYSTSTHSDYLTYEEWANIGHIISRARLKITLDNAIKSGNQFGKSDLNKDLIGKSFIEEEWVKDWLKENIIKKLVTKSI